MVMQTIRPYISGQRHPTSEYKYQEIDFTPRQENFYQNLLQMYRIIQSKHLPVYFKDDKGKKWYMDRGCVKMAVHDGFLEELQNDSSGVVSSVNLRWVKDRKK